MYPSGNIHPLLYTMMFHGRAPFTTLRKPLSRGTENLPFVVKKRFRSTENSSSLRAFSTMFDAKTAPSSLRPQLRPKIAIVGTGQIGSMLGLLSGIKQLGDVYLYDKSIGIPQGKALDLSHLSAVENFDTLYLGTTEMDILDGADVVIVTAGLPRKPGMTRDDLLDTNGEIIRSVARGLKQHCPNSFVICITNPLDAMVQLLQKESGIPPHRVVGMAGVLDSARFRYFLAEKLNVSVSSVQSLCLGGHGDTMVLLPRYTSVGGIPLPELVRMGWLSAEDVDSMIARTRNGGGEIVAHLRHGSAFFAPAAGAIHMTEAYLHDKKTLLSCAAFLNGEYNIHNLYVGVPVIIGGSGVERIVELELSSEEEKAFQLSVDSVRALVKDVMRMA